MYGKSRKNATFKKWKKKAERKSKVNKIYDYYMGNKLESTYHLKLTNQRVKDEV